MQDLIGRLDALPDPDTRALVEELLQSVMQLHGAGLRQILEIVRQAGPSGETIYAGLLADPALRDLLLVHDLHPLPLEKRLQQALAKVLPYIRSHGGDVELLELVDGMARLRLSGTCQTCPSSTITLELAVRGALEEFCPDLAGFAVEGAGQTPPAQASPSPPLACLGAAAAV